MNLENQNDWSVFAAEIWTDIHITKMKFFQGGGKMKAVLEKWGSEGATTIQLLQILNKIQRMDVIFLLQEEHQSIKKYLDSLGIKLTNNEIVLLK